MAGPTIRTCELKSRKSNYHVNMRIWGSNYCAATNSNIVTYFLVVFHVYDSNFTFSSILFTFQKKRLSLVLRWKVALLGSICFG